MQLFFLQQNLQTQTVLPRTLIHTRNIMKAVILGILLQLLVISSCPHILYRLVPWQSASSSDVWASEAGTREFPLLGRDNTQYGTWITLQTFQKNELPSFFEQLSTKKYKTCTVPPELPYPSTLCFLSRNALVKTNLNVSCATDWGISNGPTGVLSFSANSGRVTWYKAGCRVLSSLIRFGSTNRSSINWKV